MIVLYMQLSEYRPRCNFYRERRKIQVEPSRVHQHLTFSSPCTSPFNHVLSFKYSFVGPLAHGTHRAGLRAAVCREHWQQAPTGLHQAT